MVTSKFKLRKFRVGRVTRVASKAEDLTAVLAFPPISLTLHVHPCFYSFDGVYGVQAGCWTLGQVLRMQRWARHVMSSLSQHAVWLAPSSPEPSKFSSASGLPAPSVETVVNKTEVVPEGRGEKSAGNYTTSSFPPLETLSPLGSALHILLVFLLPPWFLLQS